MYVKMVTIPLVAKANEGGVRRCTALLSVPNIQTDHYWGRVMIPALQWLFSRAAQ